MQTQINEEELELVKAMQIIKKYHEKVDVGNKDFDKDVWTFVEALMKTATQKHTCPTCGAVLKLYVLY